MVGMSIGPVQHHVTPGNNARSAAGGLLRSSRTLPSPRREIQEVGVLAIRAERAFDGEQAIPGGAVVLVDGGRIVGVEPGSAPLPGGWPVVELPGATLLPGLIDAHVHLCGDSQDGALERLPGYGDAELDQVIAQALRRQLAAGVTTVRDLGDRRWAVIGWRDRLAAGAVGFPCPTIVASGPPITSPEGHCWHMGGEATGPDQLRQAVRERAERRADVVKVMTSGGNVTPGTDVMACQFTLEELRVVVEEAHALGLPVTAHAHGLPAVEQAVAAGVDGIEHGTCVTPSGIRQPEQLLAAVAARQTVVCPTLGRVPGVAPPPARAALMARAGMTPEALRAAVGRAYRAGVRLVSGSDAGIGPGKPHGVLPEGVVALVAAGVPAAAALASATSVAARACGLGDRKGRLRAGYDADLLLVDGDPLNDVGALRHICGIVLAGTTVDIEG
jgi:imidazolonepropionase-like amidohydrolase